MFGNGGGSQAAGETARVVQYDPDRALVRAAQVDPARFDALYRRYVAQVYNLAFHELGDHHEAEDVTERAFMLALAALPRFREGAPASAGPDASTFRAWLFRIVRNVAANHRRAVRRHPVADLAAAAGVAAPDDPAESVLRHEEASAAWAFVRRLPGDRRRVVILRFVHELGTAEIATVLGRSEGAVRVLLHRALRAIARDLGAAGEASPDGSDR